MKQTTISHYYTKKSISKLIKRIVIPFLLVQLFFIAYAIIRQDFTALKAIITHGGWGMGSYYPYIYLQIWLFAPLLYCLLKKRFGWIVVFALALGLNALFFKIGGGNLHEANRKYSVLLIRYLPLAVMAYMYLTRSGTKHNVIWRFLLPWISIAYWIWGDMMDLSPWILDNGWSNQQPPAFFYTYFLFYLLTVIHSKWGHYLGAIEWLGKNSYEVFLLQMIVFFIFPRTFIDTSIPLQVAAYTVFSLFCSIAPIMIYQILKKKISHSKLSMQK